MRHAVTGKQLNRDITSRRSLFKNLTLALIEHGHIETTLAKAKAITASFDKLVTKAKAGSVHDRRLIDAELNQRSAVNRLVDEIAPATKRQSGFTRITKLGNRRGDDAMMVRLEIIDWQPKVVTSVKKVEAKSDTPVKTAKRTAVTAPDMTPTKIKQPVTSNVTAKHMPQKRSTGGGK